MNNVYDVIIIGGGIVGSAIARELSRYTLKTALIEKEPDVGFGTSCRNSGVLHSGINYKPGTLRAKLAVRGNSLMDKLCSDLKVKIKRIGKLTVALDKEEMPGIERILNQGKANGVEGLRVLNHDEMQKIQPGIDGVAALWSPTSAIISPYALTIALAENACDNGVNVMLHTQIVSIEKHAGLFIIKSADGREFRAKIVVNSAGLFAGKVCEMVGISHSNEGSPTKIYPCRGEYYVLDKRLDGTLKTLVYPVPNPNKPGLGIHLTPTVDGNILIGPSTEYLDDSRRESYAVTSPVLADLRSEGQKLLPDIQMSDFIRNFAGNRAKRTPPEVGGNADFIIEESKQVKGFVNVCGIESPGLTSAPAIAEMVRNIIANTLILAEKSDFKAERKGLTCHFCELPVDEQEKLIKQYPEYGEIICRCEQITKKEIRDAIENNIGARTLVSIKYRARSGMGRCQGGFCTPKIVAMLRDEYGFKPEDYLLREGTSRMFSGNVREEK